MEDTQVSDAMRVAEAYLFGKSSQKELTQACNAVKAITTAYAIAGAAGYAVYATRAAYAAINAVRNTEATRVSIDTVEAADYAARAVYSLYFPTADVSTVRKKQHKKLDKLINTNQGETRNDTAAS